MKKLRIRKFLAGFLCILLFSGMISCNGNRLKVNEKELKNEILQQEKDANAPLVDEDSYDASDTLNNLPPGYRFTENRAVDPSRPPVVIDIAGSLGNVGDYTLSSLASGVRYIYMQPNPDTSFPRVQRFKYHMLDNYIIAANLAGIQLYDSKGRFLNTIVRNETTGFQMEEKQIIMRGDNTFIGGGTSVWSKGDQLYYKYRNSISGQSCIMEYDCSQMQLQASNTFNPEKPDLIRGLGKPVIDLNHGKKKPEKGNPQTMMSAGLDYFFDKLGTFMLSKSTYAVPMSNAMDTKGKYMLGILNARGDTLTTFRKFEQLTNFTKSVMRNTDMGSNYEYGGKMFIRSAFNDTVFQVIPPNRLLPVYVLKLGKHKLSMQEGEDLDFDLTGKIIPEGWAETKDYVFITFSMNGNDCPNNRKSGKLSTFYAIYSRATRKLTIVRSNPKDYSAEVLLNDLDGGVPVWPLSYQVSSKDELLIPLRGKDLKARVKSDEFRKSKAPSGKKEELIKMAQLVRDNDDILMIVTLK